MKPNEKMCPLTQTTCYGKNCGWWHITGCAAIAVVRNLNAIDMDIAIARDELYMMRKDLEG